MAADYAALKKTPEWTAYVAAPSGAALDRLLRSAGPESTVERALEEHFFDTNHWKVAQYLALIHARRLPPQDEESRDLVRASFFAFRARDLSNGRPAARLVLARVLWERRLPLAVFHEAGLAAEALPTDDELTEEQKAIMMREGAMLTALAAAYAGDVDRAHKTLSLQGSASGEVLTQLIVAAWPERPDIAIWTAMALGDLPPLNPKSRAAAMALHALRSYLLALLSAARGGR